MSEVGATPGEPTKLARALLDVTDENTRLGMALDSSLQEVDQLEVGLHSRNVIGQAQGILMERMNITSDQALAYLKRVSMHTNRKLNDVAGEISRTRELPVVQS